MYEARKVANFVLANYPASSQRFVVSNLRINKLLFFMHGWALAQDPKGLIRNHFEAWKFGPVLPSVYEAFKIYGDDPIQNPAMYVDYSTGNLEQVPITDIRPNHQLLIRRVFESYADHSTSRLVALSHEVGSPWNATLKGTAQARAGSPRIPNELIRSYFLMKSGGGTRN